MYRERDKDREGEGERESLYMYTPREREREYTYIYIYLYIPAKHDTARALARCRLDEHRSGHCRLPLAMSTPATLPPSTGTRGKFVKS
jgi:hypothetical protein